VLLPSLLHTELPFTHTSSTGPDPSAQDVIQQDRLQSCMLIHRLRTVKQLTYSGE